jgi:hypothetical protein
MLAAYTNDALLLSHICRVVGVDEVLGVSRSRSEAKMRSQSWESLVFLARGVIRMNLLANDRSVCDKSHSGRSHVNFQFVGVYVPPRWEPYIPHTRRVAFIHVLFIHGINGLRPARSCIPCRSHHRVGWMFMFMTLGH